MRFSVKPYCSLFLDFKRYEGGDILPALTAKAAKRISHLIEPYDDEEAEPAPAPEPAAEPVEGRAVEGDDAPAAKPARRRRAKKADA